MKTLIQIITFSLLINTVYGQKEEVVFGIGKVNLKGVSFNSEYNHEVFRNLKLGIGLNYFTTDPLKLRYNDIEQNGEYVITQFSTPANLKVPILQDISNNLFGINLNARYDIVGLIKKESKLKLEVGILMGWKQVTTLTAIKEIEANGGIVLKRTVQEQDNGVSPNLDFCLGYKFGKKGLIGLQYTFVDYEKGNAQLLNFRIGRLF